MLQKPAIEKIIPILKVAARRALRMRVPGFPKPFFCSFLLRDIEWFNTWASSGSTYRRRSDRTRNVYCNLRVGSYRSDQTMNGSIFDNDEERESVSLITMPIDDRDYDGLRMALWRLSEARFREALADFNQKLAHNISTVNPNRALPSYVRVKPSVSIKYAKPVKINEEAWVRFCKRASKWMSQFPHITSNWVEFDASQETKVFVNTEGSIIVQHFQVYSLTATLRRFTKEGSHLEQELVLNVADPTELPDMREFKRLIRKKYNQLFNNVRTKTIHSFSGPVLLYPVPAGLLFHEAIGHRLEGSRLLSTGEGQTFKGQVGKRIFNIHMTIRDNPKLKSFRGTRCIGAYDYDDEGTPSKNTVLVENGILRDFLNTRAALSSRGHEPNGHARNKKFQAPISRMGVTIVESKESVSLEQLRELLIEEINEQNKPFGMIVYETSGGETDTSSYDFQAFAGEISYATLVYPDGREVVVRGVNFVGTPLQAINNIIAIGDNPEIDNGYCGAESGFIPVTTISPAILLNNLELQAKDEALVTPYILPRPKLG